MANNIGLSVEGLNNRCPVGFRYDIVTGRCVPLPTLSGYIELPTGERIVTPVINEKEQPVGQYIFIGLLLIALVVGITYIARKTQPKR